MKKWFFLWLGATALGLPASAADKPVSASEAAAIIATQFCGAIIGEPPAEVPRVASAIPGLVLSAPMTPSQVPEPHRTQFKATLGNAPYSLFHTVSFDSMKSGSGTLLAIVARDTTICQVTTLNARDTESSIKRRMEVADSGWQAATPRGNATIFRRLASNGRSVAMMLMSAKGITPVTVYLMPPEPGSASAAAIEEFATDAMRACARVVLQNAEFESPSFVGMSADGKMGRDGALVIWTRFRIPTGVVGIERKGGVPSCTIISGDPVDATLAVEAALKRAFLALPGASGSDVEGWMVKDAASGRVARLKIAPFGERTSAALEPVF